MQAYHWIVLTMAICSQWAVHAAVSDDNPIDLAGQEEFFSKVPAFKRVTGAVVSGKPLALASATFPIISDTLEEAKEKWGGTLLPEYQELDREVQKFEAACNDKTSGCSKRFAALYDLGERYPQMFEYIDGCVSRQAKSCPKEYNDHMNVHALPMMQRSNKAYIRSLEL